MKQTFFAVLVLLAGMPLFSAEKTDNFFKITTTKDFSKGKLENAVVVDTYGDGAIRLEKKGKKYASEGSFTSKPMTIQPGDWFTPSWNAQTPDGTWVEVKISARIPHYETADSGEYWTEFLSMGKWGQSIQRGSTFEKTSAMLDSDGSQPRAAMDTDIFRENGGAGRLFTQIRLQAILHTDNPKVTPTLSLLTGSSKNSQAPNSERIVKPEMTKSTKGLDVEMKFPAYSLDIRDKTGLKMPDGTPIDKWSISCCICSPTTVLGQLNYLGFRSKKPENWLPEEIALNCQDFTYGFGNWAYCTAAVGSFGYPAYARYGDLELLKSELAAGYPVGVGVHYSNSPNGQHPYVENAPIRNTDGHLLLVRGFKTIDGVDYIFVNDSAASSDEKCILRYRCDQFLKAWEPNCMSYIIREKERGTGQTPIVQRVPATLKATKKSSDAYGREYTLMVKGKPLALDPNFATWKAGAQNGGDTNKRSQVGKGGVIGYTVEALGDKSRPKFEATANQHFYYTITSPDGNVYLSDARIQAALPKDYKGRVRVTVYVIRNNGNTYVAELKK